MARYFSRKKLVKSDLFLNKEVPPRKHLSRAANKLSATEIEREFGQGMPKIDGKIGNLRLQFNPTESVWNLDKSEYNRIVAEETAALEAKKQALEQENEQLQMKIELLLDMLAQMGAEDKLRKEIKSTVL